MYITCIYLQSDYIIKHNQTTQRRHRSRDSNITNIIIQLLTCFDVDNEILQFEQTIITITRKRKREHEREREREKMLLN